MPAARVVAAEISMNLLLRLVWVWKRRPPAQCRRPQTDGTRLVAQLLSGVDQVRVPEVVELGDALPAGSAEDAAQRLAASHDVDPRAGASVRRRRAVAAVDDGLAGPDAVNVAGRHAPCGRGP